MVTIYKLAHNLNILRCFYNVKDDFMLGIIILTRYCYMGT